MSFSTAYTSLDIKILYRLAWLNYLTFTCWKSEVLAQLQLSNRPLCSAAELVLDPATPDSRSYTLCWTMVFSRCFTECVLTDLGLNSVFLPQMQHINACPNTCLLFWSMWRMESDQSVCLSPHLRNAWLWLSLAKFELWLKEAHMNKCCNHDLQWGRHNYCWLYCNNVITIKGEVNALLSRDMSSVLAGISSCGLMCAWEKKRSTSTVCWFVNTAPKNQFLSASFRP